MPSPIHGKRFWLDPALPQRTEMSQWLRRRGGILAEVDANLDYLVLAEVRRADPGKLPAEKKAAKVPAGKITTLYEADLPPMLVATADEVLDVLHATPVDKAALEALLPPIDSAWTIDLSGADLCGLELVNITLRNLNLTGIQLRHTNLHHSAIVSPKNVDFREIRLPASMFIGQPEDCDFRGMRLENISVGGSIRCDLSDADLSGNGLGHWSATDLRAERANFADVKMPRGRLVAARLRGARFTNAELVQTDFEKADLREVDFTGANLRAARFVGANLGKAIFRDANLAEADFTGAKLTGADFTGANLAGAIGLPAKVMAKVKPETSLLRLVADLKARSAWKLEFVLTVPGDQVRVELEPSPTWLQCRVFSARSSVYGGAGDLVSALRELRKNHPDASLLIASVQASPAALGVLPMRALAEVFGSPYASDAEAETALVAARAEAARHRQEILDSLRAGPKLWNQLSRVERESFDLSRMNLAGVSLVGIQLDSVCAKETNLAGADLSRGDLCRADWSKANLSGADLSQTQMLAMKLGQANLEKATLREADLSYTNLRKANLRDADLTEANLRHAILCGADLTGTTLTGANFDRAEYDTATQFPAGFDPVAAKMKLKTTGKKVAAPKPAVDPSFVEFMEKVRKQVDGQRLGQALAMLKAERFQLFAEVDDAHLVGVVRSPSSKERFYACRLTSAGEFECGTQLLNRCAALGGRICKHLLVLLLGLTRAGSISAETVLEWMQKSRRKQPSFDKEALSTTFIKYKGVETGEVDWRPTETVPEDYYAL